MTQTPAPSGLPPVDFNDWSADFEGFSRRLGDSFVRYGFCVIAHHDLDLPRIDRALAASRAFFALPEEVKRR
ncbi:MAG: 2-oxoglutarate and iron-dependent oxygenase domain-containing protein, partial [Phenylobacterium sp.]|nr:2-oxoglutarate and iron-dependent oxygenase domain-containing protein [Phenylobacterium sp.]